MTRTARASRAACATRAARAVALAAAAFAAALLPAGTAGADDLWRELARAPETEVAEREYERALLEGDTNLEMAAAEEIIPSKRKKYLDRAIAAYELAAAARPDAAEPHFRAATALHAFYVECDAAQSAALCNASGLRGRPALPPKVVSDRLLRHWDAFEAKAPRDPRVVDDILLARAIHHTKLETREHLEAARRDYRKILAWRHSTNQRDAIVLGNLAETEMMLGNLDASIVAYRRTLELDPSFSHSFGLAVALDRDEQGHVARAILRAWGERGIEALQRAFLAGEIFYVPEGEVFYYLALGYEAIGHHEAAVQYYDAFLASGAHPRYAPRARANRLALLARGDKTPPPPPMTRDPEVRWPPRPPLRRKGP